MQLLWLQKCSVTCPWLPRSWTEIIFLKEISPEYSLEGLMLKLKLQYFGHLMWRAQLFGKDPDAGKDWRREEKGTTEDETVGWHHQLDGCEFEQAAGVGGGQGSPACCSYMVAKCQTWLSDWIKLESIVSKITDKEHRNDPCLDLPLISRFTAAFHGKTQNVFFLPVTSSSSHSLEHTPVRQSLSTIPSKLLLSRSPLIHLVLS